MWLSESCAISKDHQVGGMKGLYAFNRLNAETSLSAGSPVGFLNTDRFNPESVNAVGLIAPGHTYTLAPITISVADDGASQPVQSLFNGGMARIGSSATMLTESTDAHIEVAGSVPGKLPLATIADGNELAPSEVPEGFPVVDGDKLPAYPHQDDVVGINHAFVRNRATDMWGDFEPRLLNHADDFNRLYFFNKLPLLEIKIGSCASPRTWLGQNALRGDHGILSEITISGRLFTNSFKGLLIQDTTKRGFTRFIDDILLHEMVHAYCDLVRRQPELTYRGHGPVFTEECNRIGQILGLAPVKHSKSRKFFEEHIPKCNHWPQAVRHVDYYEGAVVDVAEPKKSKDSKKDELTKLLETDQILPGEMLRRLLYLAKNTKNNRGGRESLARTLIASLRAAFDKPDLLPQFPAELVPPGPVPDTAAA